MVILCHLDLCLSVILWNPRSARREGEWLPVYLYKVDKPESSPSDLFVHLSSLSGGPPLLTTRKPHVDILAFPKAAQRRLSTDTPEVSFLIPQASVFKN